MIQIKLITLGCKVNQYETQLLGQLFAAEGWAVCSEGDADVVVVNSCTVTAEGDRKCRQLVRRLRREHPQAVLALTGCYPQAYPAIADELDMVDVVTGSRDRAGLVAAVRERLATGDRVVKIVPHERGEQFESMSIDSFDGHTRAFVKIEDGCENYCAYCIIPTARGPVRSKPIEELRRELALIASGGRSEVVLAGINLSSYGKEYGLRLVDAIELACGIDGIARVRLGSLEPDLLTHDDIARMSQLPQLCPHFHLSLQSGCDSVLARMGRHYNTEQYLSLVDELRRCFHDAAITTDLMVGFPGESDEEFAESVSFARRVGFADIHVFAYSPREGTRAAAMDGQVDPAVKRRRSNELVAVASELRQAFLASMVGQYVEVLYEAANHDGTQSGYTRNYTRVTVTDPESLHYKLCGTLISGVTDDGCEGIVLGSPV